MRKNVETRSTKARQKTYVELSRRPQQGATSPRHNPLLHSSTGGIKRVHKPILLLPYFDLRASANLTPVKQGNVPTTVSVSWRRSWISGGDSTGIHCRTFEKQTKYVIVLEHDKRESPFLRLHHSSHSHGGRNTAAVRQPIPSSYS